MTSAFKTFFDLYLDYLTIEKGLAKNSLASYGTDLRRFGTYLAKKEIELEDVERVDIVRYFQSLRTAGISAWRLITRSHPLRIAALPGRISIQ